MEKHLDFDTLNIFENVDKHKLYLELGDRHAFNILDF